MNILIAAIVAFLVALVSASVAYKARQGADAARIALLEQRVEQLMNHLDLAPMPAPAVTPTSVPAPLAAPLPPPNLGPNLGLTQPAASVAGEPAAGLTSQVASLVARGKKIEAIKVYRDQTRVGLKEAKDAIEEIERRMGSR